MKRLLPRLLLIIAILAALAGGIWWATRPKPIPVVLVEVAKGQVESTVSNTRAGTVEACQHTKLSPIIGGRIDYLGVHEGDRVKRGQVLLKLWNQDLEAQVRVAETAVVTARKQVGQSCTLADNAERNAERSEQLRRAGFVSIEKVEADRANAKAQRAACAASQSDIAQAQAKLALARTELKKTVLLAPFDGIVADVTGELGEVTTPSPPGVPTPPAVDLIDDSCLYIKAPMDEVDAPKIRVGQPTRITLDALPGRHFDGHVKRIAPYVLTVEKQARTVDVDVDFDHPKQASRLLVGYSADVEVILAVKDDTLRIPTSALLEGDRVLVYRPATGDLEERHVQTGLSNWQYTQVLGGLKAGDRIVLSLEKEGVKAGVKVTPEKQAQGTGDKMQGTNP
jgi:HlyD family secretion protein